MQTKPIIVFALASLSAAISAAAATITVNTYGDTVGNNGKCTLREAITAANTNTASGAMAGECVAGGAALDTIVINVVFELCLSSGCTINLQTALPTITGPVSIVGPGSDSVAVQRTAGSFRIFSVGTGDLATATTISGLTIHDGLIPDGEGGAGVRNGASLLNLTNCAFVNNATIGTTGSRQGGGLLNVGGTVNVTNCTFTSCGAQRGAAIFSTGTLTVTGSTFIGNTAGFNNNTGDGGGISVGSAATTTVTDCTFTNNFAGAHGGAILTAGTFTIARCSLTGNKAGQAGGGVSSIGTCTIVESTIAGNQAGKIAGGGFSGQGGGIENSGTLTVRNSTISGNVADSGGGGIRNNAALNLTNSTVTGNSTANTSFTQGGGIDSTSTSGPIVPTFPTANIKSSIVALNSSITAPDFIGNVSSSGFNLIGKTDGSTGFTAATDRTGTIAAPLDPKLDPNGLQNNGGPTLTIALLLGSPAIDKGTSAGIDGDLTTDQRGTEFARSFDDPAIVNASGGDGTDIGAFELQTGTATRLANISTRLRVENGDNALIGGFIITGTQDKKVILRAIGPSLPFAGKLDNPTLELRDSSNALLEANDNWISSPNKQAIMDSTIPPSDDLESAIVRTLPANNAGYTAIVRGVSNGTGIGVVEAYDLEATVDSKLANISTRGLVQTGNNVLIAGMFVLGSQSQKVIVRAIGPSLPIAGKLENPTLELRDQNGGVIEANDDWVNSSNKQAIIDSGVAPSNNAESAIVRTLSPAAYTAIVRGVNDTTGIAVVEVYALEL